MKRRVFILAAAMAAAIPFSANAQTTYRMAFVAPPPVWGPIADLFAEEVAKRTGGAIRIQGVGGGQLGNLPQNYAGLKTGQIEMMLADTGTLALAKGGADFNALFAPYVFRDHAHFRAFMASSTFRQMLEPVEKEAGFKYVGYVSDRTPRQLTTSKTRVTSLEDMKGLKVRVPLTPTIKAVFEAWGAAPTPVAAAELYMAMKQGIVDGQDNGFDAIAGAKYYEVQKYAMKIDYIHSGLMVLMAAPKWNALSAAHQQAMLEAAVATEKVASPRTWQLAEKSIELIKSKGMEIVEPDLAPFKAAAAKALAGMDGKLWTKGTLDKIQAVK
ncbi:MAG: TRAP transporter substrate-binding protein [Burkholderiales bacterium]|nr:MAG: TRAP transporter substrate-binding protein [Burkholderiales bacterium]